MNRNWKISGLAIALAVLVFSGVEPCAAQDEKKIDITGAFYTKFLAGTQRKEGSLYGFSTVPAEPGGDSGQGTEIEIFIDGRLSKYLSFKSRIHSRFSQNYWTNFGGFGINTNGPGGTVVPGNCVGGDCGELDPRSNQYIKLRGVSVFITPGWRGVDTITVGSSDLGIWDAATVGKIRYIDRDNAACVFFQGSSDGRKFAWDTSYIALPRLWAGPGFNTGSFTTSDAAYVVQGKFSPTSSVDLTGIYYYVNDMEIDTADTNLNDGQNTTTRFRNGVAAAKVAWRPTSVFDLAAAYYYSNHDSVPAAGAAGSFSTYFGYSPVIAGKHSDDFWKLNLNFNDIAGSGVSIAVEAFDIGAEYTSMLAARRESDVLLTEGYDAAFMLPGIRNAGANAVFAGDRANATMGYGAFNGTRQQVATINADNNFTDFDEPAAESAIGWKGVTLAPRWNSGNLDLSGEVTFLDYNTNWQAYGDSSRFIGDTLYPSHELDAGVLHNYRTAYAPFQDKQTLIAAVNLKYALDVGKGIDLFAKVKYIDEQDDRMTDEIFLPYVENDCLGTGPCGNVKNLYNGVHSTADSNSGGPGLYENPPYITVNYADGSSASGYQWKPFDSVSDDDRDLAYWHLGLGAGYQLTDRAYATFWYDYYDADLLDGTSAFQAYRLHQWASGQHKKNSLDFMVKYDIAGGAAFGFEYQYLWGTFTPNFGTGFVPQEATAEDSAAWGVPVGSLGFRGPTFYGASNYIWNSLGEIDLTQHRLKAFLKVLW